MCNSKYFKERIGALTMALAPISRRRTGRSENSFEKKPIFFKVKRTTKEVPF